MKNFVQDGDVIEVTAPEDKSSGEGCLVGQLFGVCVSDSDSGDSVQIKTTGVFAIAKLSAQAWTQGEVIYWDDDNTYCTSSDTGVPIGVATEAADNPSATGRVRLNGFIPAATSSGI